MLRTCSVRNIPKKFGASSRRYWLPGNVPTHTKKSRYGGGHISGTPSYAHHASLLGSNLRPSDPAVGAILVVAVRARLGEPIAELVHGVDALGLCRVVFGDPCCPERLG